MIEHMVGKGILNKCKVYIFRLKLCNTDSITGKKPKAKSLELEVPNRVNTYIL